MHWFRWAPVLSLLISFSGFSQNLSSLVIGASDPHLADVVQALAGPQARVLTFDGKPPSAPAWGASCTLVFYSSADRDTGGLFLKQSWKTKLRDVSASLEPEIHPVTGNPDPQVWLSGKNLRTWSDNIKTALMEAAPHRKEDFQKNALRFNTELDQRTAAIRVYFLSLRSRQRTIVTEPSVFPYFCRDFGFTRLTFSLPPKGTSPPEREEAWDGLRRLFLTKIQDPGKVLFLPPAPENMLKVFREEFKSSAGFNAAFVPVFINFSATATPGEATLNLLEETAVILLEGLQSAPKLQ